jgi:hypothetical protein
VFRITDDINYDLEQDRIKEGWQFIDSSKLSEIDYSLQVLTMSLSNSITEYELMLDFEVKKIYELLLIKKLQTFEGIPPSKKK